MRGRHSGGRAPRSRLPLVLGLVLLLGFGLLLAWPTISGSGASGESTRSAEPTHDAARTPEEPSETSEPSVDRDEVLSWGPTVGELADAQALVKTWTPEQLAGQVIVGRYAGSDPSIPAQLVEDLHLAGVSVTNGNVVDDAQGRAPTVAVSAAMKADGRDFPAVLGVDQEGGSVEHLRGIATVFPAYVYAGAGVARDREAGAKIVDRAAFTTGLELRDFGFTWVFAPVGDVTIGDADVTIGTRSPSEDPEVAAATVAASVEGFNRAGIVSTTKHFPGHGQVTADSHEQLPVLESSLQEIRDHDLPPFEAAIAAKAPSIMTAHVDVEAIAPGRAGSMDERMYDFLRDDLGFEGVTITDSLGMGGALSEPFPAVNALNAGADLLLMPVDTAQTHRTLTAAIKDGRVTRERVEEAAAKVIAVQRWQARIARSTPVPDDVTEQAQAAAQALTVGP